MELQNLYNETEFALQLHLGMPQRQPLMARDRCDASAPTHTPGVQQMWMVHKHEKS